jgi:transposase
MRSTRRWATRLAPFREQHIGRLTQIPGVSLVVASAIVSELGVDMSRFPTIGHLISWAGLCPRSDESAGKRRSTRIRKGAPWLKTLLLQSAWAAARVKGTYLQAQFQRLKARRGPKKAIVAVAASILTAAYAMLSRGVDYVDLTAEHFNHTERSKVARRLLNKLGALGYDVSAVRPPAEAASVEGVSS